MSKLFFLALGVVIGWLVRVRFWMAPRPAWLESNRESVDVELDPGEEVDEEEGRIVSTGEETEPEPVEGEVITSLRTDAPGIRLVYDVRGGLPRQSLRWIQRLSVGCCRS